MEGPKDLIPEMTDGAEEKDTVTVAEETAMAVAADGSARLKE